MNREKLMKAFSELYIGENTSRLVKEYYRKKYKDLLMILILGICIVSFCYIKDIKKSHLKEENRIIRNAIQDGQEEILLQTKTEEGEWKDVLLTLYPKEYTHGELEELYSEACQLLPSLLEKSGISLDYVSSDLVLMEEIEGFPFSIQWESSRPDILDDNGTLLSASEKIDEEVKLIAVFEYKDWTRKYLLSVRVVRQENKDFIDCLEEELRMKEENTREQKEFCLPQTYQEQPLQWRYPRENSAILMGLFFLGIMPVLAVLKDREIHSQILKRKEQLQASFPEFIAKLILLLEAGLSIRSAMFQIVEDYQKKGASREKYLFQELSYICRKMKNGLSEKEAYELLAKRCNLSCYKKVSGMLIQHLYKGGSSILFELREESIRAGEEEKRILQKKGEEIGTKLLFPMILMLGIVMVFIMVPALFSFQI